MNHRVLRVRELMKRELSETLQRDFSFQGVLVTVNDVDMTPDLRHAHVYLGIIGNDAQKGAVLRELAAKRGVLQGKLGKRAVLKYTPMLHFRTDDSVERGVRVVSLMDRLDEISPPPADAIAGDGGEGGSPAEPESERNP